MALTRCFCKNSHLKRQLFQQPKLKLFSYRATWNKPPTSWCSLTETRRKEPRVQWHRLGRGAFNRSFFRRVPWWDLGRPPRVLSHSWDTGNWYVCVKQIVSNEIQDVHVYTYIIHILKTIDYVNIDLNADNFILNIHRDIYTWINTYMNVNTSNTKMLLSL